MNPEYFVAEAVAVLAVCAVVLYYVRSLAKRMRYMEFEIELLYDKLGTMRRRIDSMHHADVMRRIHDSDEA